MRKEIESQIRKITQALTLHSISRASNFPKWDDHSLVWERFQNLSFTLKNEPYPIIYNECLQAGDFNIVLIDGALIQMKYKFYREEIIEHVLAFYPSPNLNRFQDELNEEQGSQATLDDLFSEIIDDVIVCTPLRFDFSNDEKKFRDVDHPRSHLTIGNYKNCRIPVKNPISPFRFMKFILRNFYYDLFTAHLSDNYFKCELHLGDTITQSERGHLHFFWV